MAGADRFYPTDRATDPIHRSGRASEASCPAEHPTTDGQRVRERHDLVGGLEAVPEDERQTPHPNGVCSIHPGSRRPAGKAANRGYQG